MASSTFQDTESCKILGRSDKGYLMEFSVKSGSGSGSGSGSDSDSDSGSASSRILIDDSCNRGCSFSPPIDNRYIYMVGGKNQSTGELTSDVFYYDLIDHKRYQGPSIITPRWAPRLIVLGSKLFAFFYYSSDSSHICEVLDTASKPSVWRLLETCPNLPFGREYDPSCYFIISYATHINDNLFLSLGDGNASFAVCFNASNDRWSNISEMPLPFYDQGKFVDDICYGFPIPEQLSNYLASYKLSVDWESIDPKVSCQQLAKYELSIPLMRHLNFVHSFFALSSNVFIITRARKHGIFNPQYSLEVDVVQLLSPDSAPSPPNCQFGEDSKDSNQVLNHTSIFLDRPLEAIVGDYNQ